MHRFVKHLELWPASSFITDGYIYTRPITVDGWRSFIRSPNKSVRHELRISKDTEQWILRKPLKFQQVPKQLQAIASTVKVAVHMSNKAQEQKGFLGKQRISLMKQHISHSAKHTDVTCIRGAMKIHTRHQNMLQTASKSTSDLVCFVYRLLGLSSSMLIWICSIILQSHQAMNRWTPSFPSNTVLHNVVHDSMDISWPLSISPCFCALKFFCVELSSLKYTKFLANHGLFRKLLCV